MVAKSGAAIRVKARHPLSKRERRELLGMVEALGSEYVDLVKGSSRLEIARVASSRGEVVLYIVDGTPALVIGANDSVEPVLYSLVQKKIPFGRLPRLIVDRGAASAVARGARLMVPGIRMVEGDFGNGDVVVIVDEASGVPVAVARALMDSSTLRSKLEAGGRGPAAKVTQKPGDAVWQTAKVLSS